MSAMQMTLIGTLSQKMECQFIPPTTAPPMRGPTAIPSPETPPQIPMAAARILSGTDVLISANERGTIADAPNPWIARAIMRVLISLLTPHHADAAVKIKIPLRKIRRRPNRSASAEDMRMQDAKVSV